MTTSMSSSGLLVGCAVFVAFLAGCALVLDNCPGPFDSDRISASEAERIRARNEEVMEALPIFADSRLVRQTQLECQGAYEYEDTSACGLRLTYATDVHLAQVLPFYEQYFASAGWVEPTHGRDLQTRFFKKASVLVQVHVWVPALTCPDEYTQLEAALRCKERWISRNGGKYSIRISPD